MSAHNAIIWEAGYLGVMYESERANPKDSVIAE
jgi:hypothetical protein